MEILAAPAAVPPYIRAPSTVLARVSPELTWIEGVMALVNEVAPAMPPVLLEVLALRAAGTGLGAELGSVEEVGAVVEEPATHPAILLEPGAGRAVPTPRALEAPRGGGLGAPRAEAAHASAIIIGIAYSTAPKGPGTESVILRAVEATAKHGGVNFGGTGGGNGGVEPGRCSPLLGGDGSGTNGTADRWRRSTAKAAVGCVAIGAIAIGHAVLGWCSAGNGPGLFLGVRRNDTPQSVIRDEHLTLQDLVRVGRCILVLEPCLDPRPIVRLAVHTHDRVDHDVLRDTADELLRDVVVVLQLLHHGSV